MWTQWIYNWKTKTNENSKYIRSSDNKISKRKQMTKTDTQIQKLNWFSNIEYICMQDSKTKRLVYKFKKVYMKKS